MRDCVEEGDEPGSRGAARAGVRLPRAARDGAARLRSAAAVLGSFPSPPSSRKDPESRSVDDFRINELNMWPKK